MDVDALPGCKGICFGKLNPFNRVGGGSKCPVKHMYFWNRLKTQMTSREMSFEKRKSLNYFLSWLIAANNETRNVFANGLLDPVGTK